jgi:hypothetical protein
VKGHLTGAMAAMDHSLQILRNQPWEVKEPAMNLLRKLIGNVASDPNNEKFRKLRADNPKLSKCLWSVPGCTDFLLAAGFQWTWMGDPEERFCVLRKSDRLADASEEIQDFVEVETNRQLRHERDERIALAKAEEVCNNKFTRARLSPELQQYAEERNNIEVPNNATPALMEKDPTELTVVLQTLTHVIPMVISRNASVGELRDKTARQRNCYAEQVTLTLVVEGQEGMKLWENHRELGDCGFTDGCSVMVSIREADEIQHHAARLKRLSGSAVTAPLMDTMASDMSFSFTKEVLDAARERNIISKEQARQFKRSMHSGEVSQKEVRDQVIAQADGDPFRDIIEKYVNSESGICQVVERVNQCDTVAERNRRYSEMIAEDNRRGLMMAASR